MPATNGETIPDTIIGPRKERGTTPGNSWWSYCEKKEHNILIKTCFLFVMLDRYNVRIISEGLDKRYKI